MVDLVPVSLGKHSRPRRISLPSFPAFQLARATVRDPKTGVLTVASYRVSKRLAEVVVVVGEGVAAQALSPGLSSFYSRELGLSFLPPPSLLRILTLCCLLVLAVTLGGECETSSKPLAHLPFSPSFGLARGWRRTMTLLWLE